MSLQNVSSLFDEVQSTKLQEITQVKVASPNLNFYIVNEKILVRHDTAKRKAQVKIFDKPVKKLMVKQGFVWVAYQGFLSVFPIDSLAAQHERTVEVKETFQSL